MEAGFQQYRSRTQSSPHFDYYHYTPCVRSKTSDADMPPSFTIARLRFPSRPDGGACRYESSAPPFPPLPLPLPPPPPPPRRRTSQSPAWTAREDAVQAAAAFAGKPVHMRKPSIEAWVDEQIHLSDRSNYAARGRPVASPASPSSPSSPGRDPGMPTEELRQRMRDELVYEYEAEAHKWMNHETEMRRREREEARRRIVQEDVMRIQARVRERRDTERRAIAEERRRSVERAREKVRRDQARAEREVVDAWEAHEARWAEVAAGSSSSEPLRFGDVPWPVVEAPKEVGDLTPEKIEGFLLHPAIVSNQPRRDRIRTALLRWHPDRFRRILNRVVDSDKEVVEEGVGVIARCLNELLAKEGSSKTSQQGK